MTTDELLTLCDDLYPNAATDATKVIYMNMAQKVLSAEGFGSVVTDETLETVADDDEYSFPEGLSDISQIEYLEIEQDADEVDYIVASTNLKVGAYTIANQPSDEGRISFLVTTQDTGDTLGTVAIVGTVDGSADGETVTLVANARVWSTKVYSALTSLTGAGWVIDAVEGTADTIQIGQQTDRYNYQRYKASYTNDNQAYSNTYRQGYNASGTKSLILYPIPSTSGFNIRIRYKKDLTALSSTATTASPDFDSRFHELLAFYAAYMLASKGASADYPQANSFAQQYEAYRTGMWEERMKRERSNPQKRRDNEMWRRV